ncbi:hypothetical protein Clacol_000306 [Clathrus columnatus]|uniref:Uncharacterized protein n=1 Tax=Clathrus columnatus TaxID=1419009 RepID=A0AAV4ZYG6_9AGAM|nr:hypothetical protein Clacol_000306 [Clathrus columnatus]
MAIALSIALIIPAILQIYANIAISLLIRNVFVLLSDVLAFIAVIWSVWGTLKFRRDFKRKLKQGLLESIESSCIEDLAKQGILRFSLSALLVCELLIDLRQREVKRRSDPSETPSLLVIRNLTQTRSENIEAELAKRNDLTDLNC